MKYLMTITIVGLLTAGASAAVVVGGTETFTASGSADVQAADWGVGGATAFDGWQVDKWATYPGMSYLNGNSEFFGNTAQTMRTAAQNQPLGQDAPSKGQPVPAGFTHSGNPGTLVVTHLAAWGGGAPGSDPPWTSNQIKYISFNSVAGVTYTLQGWVNVVFGQDSAAWDAKHPRVVRLPSQFPDVRIGLKNGLISADASDCLADWTQVTGLVDNMQGGAFNSNAWVQTPLVSLVGDGGPMTIILQAKMPDTSSGAKDTDGAMWDLDVRFDDIVLTPEPSALALLGLGLTLVLRRR